MSPSPKILLLVCGSIAVYKACYLVSKLTQLGAEVKVAASKSALEFVGIPAFEALSHNAVAYDTFEEGRALDHINLMRWADVVLVAPATANFINRSAHGVADDLLGTLFLAHDFKKPLLIAPAMNTQMYLHPTTQASLGLLRGMGITILETESGVLACGETGWGKLLDPDLIAEATFNALPVRPAQKSKPRPAPKVLVTSGGCVEAIDAVRHITNISTGRTGARLAEHFAALGFDVTYVGQSSAPRPEFCAKDIGFLGFADLEAALKSELSASTYDLIIHAAAVSDYSVAGIEAAGETQTGAKIGSDFEDMSIRLKKNPKLINHLRQWSKNIDVKIVGFKLTGTDDPEAITKAVTQQIKAANSDLVVQNAVSDIKAEKGQHRYHLYGKDAARLGDFDGVQALAQGLSVWFIKEWDDAARA